MSGVNSLTTKALFGNDAALSDVVNKVNRLVVIG